MLVKGHWYSDAQMNWFKTKMLEHQNGKPALIFIHQPLPPKGKEGGLYQLIRATEFCGIVSHTRMFLCFLGIHTVISMKTAIT